MADQMLVEVEPALDVVLGRGGKAGRHPGAVQDQRQRRRCRVRPAHGLPDRRGRAALGQPALHGGREAARDVSFRQPCVMR